MALTCVLRYMWWLYEPHSLVGENRRCLVCHGLPRFSGAWFGEGRERTGRQLVHDLQGSLNGGDRLAITERSGAVTKGRFVALSDQSLRVMAESARLVDLPESSVARIDHLRSRKGKGALIGLIGGAVVGVLAVAVTPSCSGCIGPTKAEAAPVLAAFFGGIGAGIGAVVGAKRPHRRLSYLAPGGWADVP